jgi:hypothetical protein
VGGPLLSAELVYARAWQRLQEWSEAAIPRALQQRVEREWRASAALRARYRDTFQAYALARCLQEARRKLGQATPEDEETKTMADILADLTDLDESQLEALAKRAMELRRKKRVESRRAETLGKRLMPRLQVAAKAVKQQIAALQTHEKRILTAVEEVAAGREPDLTGLKLGRGVAVPGEKRPQTEAQLEGRRKGLKAMRAKRGISATRKLSDEQVREIRGKAASGTFPSQLAREYGLSVGTVSSVIRRKTYSEVE